MGRRWHAYLLAAALGMAGGCSKDGGGAAGGTVGGSGELTVISHSPDHDATQIAVATEISVTFDGVLPAVVAQLDHFMLASETESMVAGTLRLEQGGRTVVFAPAAPLAMATDFTFTVSAEICDTVARTMPEPFVLRFRSLDVEPPTIRAATVSNGATNVGREGPFMITFSERLDPATVDDNTVMLKDTLGQRVLADVSLSNERLEVDPVPDLVGSTVYVLSIRGGPSGVTDRAGNPLGTTWIARFTTAIDNTPPTLVTTVPRLGATGRTPLSKPALLFSESMDPGSFEPTNLFLFDEFSNFVLFTLSASPNLRTLRLMPSVALAPNREYFIAILGGPIGLTDLSGNSILGNTLVSFRTGTDATAPQVSTAFPTNQSTRVSPNFIGRIVFTEPIDRDTVTRTTVALTTAAGDVYVTPTLSQDGRTLTVTPADLAPKSTAHTLRLRGGLDGVCDVAGNPLAQDLVVGFTTSDDDRIPAVILSPINGAISVPINSRIVALFDRPMDTATVGASALTVTDRGRSQAVAGSVTLERGGRALVFEPATDLPGGATLDVTLAGGAAGIRNLAGNWLTDDVRARLHTSFSPDSTPPTIEVSINEISALREEGLVVPPSGFRINSSAFETGDGTLDMSTLELDLQGQAGNIPTATELFLASEIRRSTAVTRVPPHLALSPGRYTLFASVQDLSGNRSELARIRFDVAEPTAEIIPFDRTQLVWVMFHADRESKGAGNGVADFDEDLFDLGLLAANDPIGRNAFMRQVVIDAVLARANTLFGRNPDGSPIAGQSVSIRFSAKQPCHPTHMRIAFGGQDPGNGKKRVYGEDSTGVLGRALFDHRNGFPAENNAATSPSLGVFLGEMFLYEGKIYKDLYPYYTTRFGGTYRTLSPHMNGTPVGAHALDPVVLADNFDFNSATPNQKLRYEQIFRGVDDVAAAMGVILAHEVGHSIGLTARGPAPSGLYGDSSLHNAVSQLGDVMSAFVSWDSLVTVEYAFRDLNMAYLQHRCLVK